jgi:streptogramin lyase
LWFPMPMSNSIGMLNLGTSTFSQWPVPTAGAGPWDVAIDHTGKVWFSEHYTNKIGYFNPSSQSFTEIATPAANSKPYGITVDASNNVWFTENNSSIALIGEYTSGGKLLEYKIRNGSTSGLTPHLITIAPNGNVWWTEGWASMIGELQVALASPGTNNGVTEYNYPKSCNTCGTHTSGISVDSYGQIWFDDSLQSIFGSFPDSGKGSFATYPTPTANSHPHDGLNVDSQNRIWFTEEFANKLAYAIQGSVPTPTPTLGVSPTSSATATPSPTVTVTPSPSPSPSPSPTPTGTLAQDTFQRANQKFWGKASDGLTWGGDANSASAFSIVNNTGQVANGSTSYSAVLGPSATNAEVLFSGSLSVFNNTNLGAVLRWTDGNNW